mmetsp:Transcript_18396/g.29628  ORF Transcript_18396/g.29628 Transcript_18396/m.29628 type:complete len:83 (-) Transcript_18396:368-616(-)
MYTFTSKKPLPEGSAPSRKAALFPGAVPGSISINSDVAEVLKTCAKATKLATRHALDHILAHQRFAPANHNWGFLLRICFSC